MYRPTYELASFTTISSEEKILVLEAMLEALILANVFYLRRTPNCTPLYNAGVPYVDEPPGRDNWQDIPRHDCPSRWRLRGLGDLARSRASCSIHENAKPLRDFKEDRGLHAVSYSGSTGRWHRRRPEQDSRDALMPYLLLVFAFGVGAHVGRKKSAVVGASSLPSVKIDCASPVFLREEFFASHSPGKTNRESLEKFASSIASKYPHCAFELRAKAWVVGGRRGAFPEVELNQR